MTTIENLNQYDLKQLLSGDGCIVNVGNDMINDEEEYHRSRKVNMTPDEIIRSLNLDEMTENDEKAQFIYGHENSYAELKQKMKDVLGNGKLYKYVVKEGIGAVVPDNSRVTIKYVGFFEYQDEPFDSSALHRREGVSFRLNEGEMLPGLDLGVSTMKMNETAVFIIHPDLAYGAMGCAPRIPPNSEVFFNVTLTDLLDDSQVSTYENLTAEEKSQFKIMEHHLESLIKSANDYFKRNNLKAAIIDYNKAMTWLEKVQLASNEEEKKMKKWLSRVYVNLGVCYMKQKKPRHAARELHKVYNGYHTAKSHFNLGKALGQLGEYKEAMSELQKALQLEPGNQTIRDEITNINDQSKKYAKDLKKLWTKCLNIQHEPEAKSEFEKVAIEICESFANDPKAIKRSIPDGLTMEEENIFRKAAAVQGLYTVRERRNGKESLFISKKEYKS